MTPYFQQDGITLYHGDNVATMQQVIPDQWKVVFDISALVFFNHFAKVSTWT